MMPSASGAVSRSRAAASSAPRRARSSPRGVVRGKRYGGLLAEGRAQSLALVPSRSAPLRWPVARHRHHDDRRRAEAAGARSGSSRFKLLHSLKLHARDPERGPCPSPTMLAALMRRDGTASHVRVSAMEHPGVGRAAMRCGHECASAEPRAVMSRRRRRHRTVRVMTTSHATCPRRPSARTAGRVAAQSWPIRRSYAVISSDCWLQAKSSTSRPKIASPAAACARGDATRSRPSRKRT